MQTPYTLPTSIIANAPGVNGWLNPTNVFVVNNNYAVSTGSSNVMTVGNFNLNIPQGSEITNFTVQIKGYCGSFATTLQIYAVDDTTGVTLSYPLAPFSGFSGINTLYTLPSSLFGTTWTVNQANNIKFTLIADGELFLDAILVSASYVAATAPNETVYYDNLSGTFQLGEILNDTTSGASGTIATNDGVSTLTLNSPSGNFIAGDTIVGASSFASATVSSPMGQTVVDEFVEAQPFNLAMSMTSTDLYMFLQSFNYPDGVTQIQYADFYGEADMVIDQGVQGYEEQVIITNVEQNYQGIGLVRLSFGSLNNRGLKFSYPYTTQAALRKPHFGTAQCVISNSARFYSRFLKRAQIGALVSAPITVDDQGSPLTTYATEINFTGAGVSTTNDGTNPAKKNVVIAGNGVNTPTPVATSSSTSGSSSVATLTWNHVSSGTNRLLVVQVSTTSTTVSGITFNGVALTQGVANTHGTIDNEQWYLVAPTVGTYPIVVTLESSSTITAGAETFNTVNQSVPIGVTQTATGTSTTPSLVLTTGADNSVVLDSLATNVLPIVYTPGAGQQVNWSITANPNTNQGGSSLQIAGGEPDAVTMDWSITQSIAWAQNAMEIKGISFGAGVTKIIAGTNVTISPSGGTGEVTINTAGGGGGVLIETNSTPNGSQALLNLLNGSNVTITEDGSGNVTISSTGGSGGGISPASPGQFFPTISSSSSFFSYQYVKFGNYLFAYIGNTWHQYGIDAATGSPTVGVPSITTGTGLSISDDGLTLYSLNVSGLTITLRSYDTSLSLLSTSSITFGSGTITSPLSIASGGCIAFFVLGSLCIACLQNSAAGNNFWTEFTISGSSLTTPTVTNLQFYNGSVLQTHASQYATTDSSSNVYIQLGVNSNLDTTPTASLDKFTYSSPNFTNTGSSNMPISDWSDTSSSGGGTSNGGFTIPTLSTVGWYRNCSVTNHANTHDIALIYNEYSQ